jgi:hypothetical protein
MKLNNFLKLNKNKILPFFYLLLILGSYIDALESTRKSHKRHHSHRSSNTPPSNPGVKLFLGFTQGLIGSETSWESCLPPEYLSGSPTMTESGFVDEQFKALSPKLEAIKTSLSQVQSVVNWFCSTQNYRETLVNLYAWTFSHKSKRRRIFLEGHFKRSRNLPKKDFFIKIGNSVVCAAQTVAAECNHIKDMFDTEKQRVLDAITPHIENLKAIINEIFNQPGLKKLIQYGKCVVDASHLATESAHLIGGFGETVDTVVIHGATNVGFIKIAKIVWNIICKISDFNQVIDLTASAVNANSPDNYYFWGQALGKLINTIGNTSRKRKFK